MTTTTSPSPAILFARVRSPIGLLLLTRRRGRGLLGLITEAQVDDPATEGGAVKDDGAFTAETLALARYFDGAHEAIGARTLDLDFDQGTPFQRDVWRALQAIPRGETVTYGDVAKRAGRPSAIRAVGAAIGKNPWGIVVPCHRVVGSNGTLTGFAGGLARKRWLLEHEGVQVFGGADLADPAARAIRGRSPLPHFSSVLQG